jgi:hypothetical protein
MRPLIYTHSQNKKTRTYKIRANLNNGEWQIANLIAGVGAPLQASEPMAGIEPAPCRLLP